MAIFNMPEASKRKISIITPCFNEQDNVADVYGQVKAVFLGLSNYEYEHIFIDNASRDKTVEILKKIAQEDKRVKIIVNTRNFGHIRSPYHALMQAGGDAAVFLAADLQEPPALIVDFVKKWQEGFKVVIGIKNKSDESPAMFLMRKAYYNILKRFAEIEHVSNYNGFGLYDRNVIEALRKFDEPYPYFRSMINEVGFERAELKYTQAERKKGKSRNSFYVLYDMAMLGFVNNSKVPLRLASFIGFGMSIFSFLIALVYLIRKLIHWQDFQLGLAPLVVGIFFLGSIQLFFIGVLGEYVGAIYTQTKKRPLVIEKERINF